MKKDLLRKKLRLYAVTPQDLPEEELYSRVAQALKGGITCLQLREKHRSDTEMIRIAKHLKALCAPYRVPLIINDRIAVALASEADGVHVGQSDMQCEEARRQLGEDAIIGVSAATIQEAEAAQRAGADYLGVGAVFPTGSKEDATLVDHEILHYIRKNIALPIVAIGGIQKENLSELAPLHLDGIAVISAIFQTEDITTETKRLEKILEQEWS